MELYGVHTRYKYGPSYEGPNKRRGAEYEKDIVADGGVPGRGFGVYRMPD
jgi:hypothetical protein